MDSLFFSTIRRFAIDPEILVVISMRLPQVDRRALGEHLQDVMKEAVIAGGDTTSISLQPYDPEEDSNDSN
jgi:hypothetical protein